MRAIVVDTVRVSPEVRSVPDPALRRRRARARRGDRDAARLARAGHEDITFPHVPGHELAGVVVEAGREARRWRPGDRVTVPFVCGCGRCEWCRAGQAQVCPRQQQPGFTHWGSFAELVALHAADANLVAVPEQVSYAAAASLGCRFATAYRALGARARLAEGEWVTVVAERAAVMIARVRAG